MSLGGGRAGKGPTLVSMEMNCTELGSGKDVHSAARKLPCVHSRPWQPRKALGEDFQELTVGNQRNCPGGLRTRGVW